MEKVPFAERNKNAPPSEDAFASPFLFTLLLEKEQFVNEQEVPAPPLL